MSTVHPVETTEDGVRTLLAGWGLKQGAVINHWKVSLVGLDPEGTFAVARFVRDADNLRVTLKLAGAEEYFARIGDVAIAHDQVEPRLGPDAGSLLRDLAAWLEQHGSGSDLAELLSHLPPPSLPSAEQREAEEVATSPPPSEATELPRAVGDTDNGGGGRGVKQAIREIVGARQPPGEECARRLFRDDALEEEYRREGFVIHPGFGAEELAQLKRAFGETRCSLDSAFYTTLWSNDASYRRSVNQALKAIFEPMIDQILLDYRYCFGAFASKAAAAAESSMAFHQDWSIVDETRFQAVNLWCPFVDVDSENGCLGVVPRSHRLADVPRPNSAPGEFVSPFDGVLSFLQDHFASAIPLSAGRIIILNPAVLHGSGENRSQHERAAAGVMAVPREAAALHYFRISSDHIEVFEVDDEFYRHTVTPMNRPSSEVLLGTIRCRVDQLTEDDVYASGMYSRVNSQSDSGASTPNHS
jgi:hypothetical protein